MTAAIFKLTKRPLTTLPNVDDNEYRAGARLLKSNELNL